VSFSSVASKLTIVVPIPYGLVRSTRILSRIALFDAMGDGLVSIRCYKRCFCLSLGLVRFNDVDVVSAGIWHLALGMALFGFVKRSLIMSFVLYSSDLIQRGCCRAALVLIGW
jgi:hypothetical protein